MRKPQQTPAQAATPYIDALLRYRASGIVPFHTPGHKLGKGAPPDHARGLRRRPARPSTSPWPAASRTRASRPPSCAPPKTWPPRPGAASAASFWSTARPAASTPCCSRSAGPGDGVILPRNAHKSVQAGAHLLGRRAALRRARGRPRLGHPPQRARRARRRRRRGPPRSQGRVRRLAQQQRHLRGARRDRRRGPRRPACRSSSTRPGGRTCASAAACRSTPCRPAPTPWWPARTS